MDEKNISTKPNVSVIIPTYNRKDMLYKTLASLEKQEYPKDKFEVIIADDGSTDGTSELATAKYMFNIIYERQSNQGSAKARNLGAKSATGDLLVFLDDDILLDTKYIGALREQHQQYPRIVGMGIFKPYILPDATHFYQIYSRLTATDNIEPGGSFVNFTRCVTNNLSVKREDFLDIGMMEDVAGDGPTWWGDIDFGYRAFQLGYQFRCCEKAICYHDDYSILDLPTASARAKAISSMAVKLFHKYPKIRSYLPMFRDKTPIDWRLDSLSLINRKIARITLSSQPAMRFTEQIIMVFERIKPDPLILGFLYQLIIGGNIFRGYREGLLTYRQLNKDKLNK